MERIILQSFKEQILSSIIIPEGRLALAFSGGSDSLALLSLLPKERSIAVYVNHNLRDEKELEKELDLNAENAMRFGIPLKIITLEKGSVSDLAQKERIGLEAAARKLRYEKLLSLDVDYVMTAHHKDDQAETIIMRILSGSPIYKMEGIRRQNGRIFRPLLTVSKDVINGYLKEENLSYSFDSTNDDIRYKRNYIRHNILPLLSEKEKDMLSSIALNMQKANERGEDIQITEGEAFSFSRSDYISSNPLKRAEVFYKINGELGYSSRLPRGIIKNADRSIVNSTSFFCDRFILKTNDDDVKVFRKRDSLLLDGCNSFNYQNLVYKVNTEKWDEKTLKIDFKSLSYPVVFRLSRSTDIIELKEGRKRLKELEKEYKVPYFFILEDRNGIIAVFARIFGAKDRLAKRLLNKDGVYVSLEDKKCFL